MRMAQKGDHVIFHFIMMRPDGSILDSSHPEPMSLILDPANIIAGVYEAILGMAPGEMKTVEVPASRAYGPVLPEVIVEVSRRQLPGDCEVGDVVAVEATRTESRPPMRATVRELTAERALVDLNHPLAGQDLTFRLELLEIV